MGNFGDQYSHSSWRANGFRRFLAVFLFLIFQIFLYSFSFPTFSGTCTITANQTYSQTDLDTCGGGTLDDLVVNVGVTLTLTEAITVVDSVTINGTVDHPAQDTDGVTITANEIDITGTGSINVNGKGCSGGASGQDGLGPHLSSLTCTVGTSGFGDGGGSGAGAGYGGEGADSWDNYKGPSFGFSGSPIYLGAGGGGASNNGANGIGGAGGGLVRLTASTTLNVDGSISANANNGSNSGWGGGGGSGGSIYLTADVFDGNGSLNAQGGNGGTGATGARHGAKGGGGRIAVFYKTDASTLLGGLSAATHTAAGTTGYSGSASAGTVHSAVIPNPAPAGTCQIYTGGSFTQADLDTCAGGTAIHLNIETGATVELSGTITLTGDVTIKGEVFHSNEDNNGIDLRAKNIFIDASGSIDVTGKGCQGVVEENGRGPHLTTGVCTDSTSGYGQEGATASPYFGTGGAHGGIGGRSSSDNFKATAYGLSTEPTFLGSSGGAYRYGLKGHAGGGLVYIEATETLDIDGTIKADGNGSVGTDGYQAGAGSGGSVWIITDTLDGNGSITAKGGTGSNGGANYNGAGGGGRVAIYYRTNSSTYLAGMTATTSTAKGTSPSATYQGGDGTLVKEVIAIPVLPSVTAPTGGSTSVSSKPLVTSSAAAGLHTNTDWKITTDAGGSNIVWSSLSDTTNKTSILVNTSNGTFAGALAGETQLDSGTSYYVFVRHTNDEGSSAWSAGNAFTVANGSCIISSDQTFTHDELASCAGGIFDYLIVNNGVTLTVDTSVTVNEDITIHGTVTHAAEDASGVVLSAKNIWITSTGQIDTNGLGCAGGVSADGRGPNLGTGLCAISTSGYGASRINSSGAGYGGAPGNGKFGGTTYTWDGSLYGSNTAPVFLGSGAGGSIATGGSGGGYIQLTASGTLKHDGPITANGTNGTIQSSRAGGGGSGGSIYIIATTLDGTGIITANAGNAGGGNGGAGGGGRVSISYVQDNSSFVSGLTAANTAARGTVGQTASDGSLYVLAYTVPNQPSVTAPVDTAVNQILNPVVSGSAFSSNGYGHLTTDWKISTDAAGTNIVWSSLDGSSNLVSVTVNSSNGTFANNLAGRTQLAANTQYYAFVRYKNGVGYSSWSASNRFTTTLSTANFTSASQSVGEAVGSVMVSVSLDHFNGADVSVPFTLTGTASAADHSLVNGSITVTAGTTLGSVSFNIVNDGVDESNETVILTMGNPVTANKGGSTQHQVTIIDDDVTPISSDGTLVVSEDVSLSASLDASDGDGDVLTYSIVSAPTLGSVNIDNVNTGAYTYTPNLNVSGADSFTFKVNDGSQDSNTATVNVVINSVNDAPTLSSASLTVVEDTAKSGTLVSTDAENDTLTHSVASQGSKGQVAFTDASAGRYTYTPNLNATGTDTFTYQVTDGQASSTGTVSVTITAVNDAPTGQNQTVTVTESGHVIQLQGVDVDGDSLTYTIVSQPELGRLVVNPVNASQFIYSFEFGQQGTDQFSYKVSDGVLSSATYEVDVSLDGEAINQAPEISILEESFQARVGTSAVMTSVVSDESSDVTYLWSLVSGEAVEFSATDAPAISFLVPERGATGQVTIKLTVSDGELSSEVTETVTILNDTSMSDTDYDDISQRVVAIRDESFIYEQQDVEFEGEVKGRRLEIDGHLFYADSERELQILNLNQQELVLGYSEYSFNRGMIVKVDFSTWTGTTLDLDEAFTQTGIQVVEGTEPNEFFGEKLSLIDLNQDGVSEIAVLSPGADYGVLGVYDQNSLALQSIISGAEGEEIGAHIWSSNNINDSTAYSDVIIGVSGENEDASLSSFPAFSLLASNNDGEPEKDVDLNQASETVESPLYSQSASISFKGILGSNNNGLFVDFAEDEADFSVDFDIPMDRLVNGDLNNDGLGDFVFASSSSCHFYIIFGHANIGQLGYKQLEGIPVTCPVDGLVFNSIAIRDVTADGIDDLIMGVSDSGDTRGKIYILPGKKIWREKAFNWKNGIYLEGELESEMGRWMLFGDFDGDGFDDIFTNNGPGEQTRVVNVVQLLGLDGNVQAPTSLPLGNAISGGGCSLVGHGKNTSRSISLLGFFIFITLFLVRLKKMNRSHSIGSKN